ncbi:hypothetical protein [Actinomadura litoris]|uniref:Uncharacterized protein n=1 Tax=Actinomadura litoris TaxID=2678616 RepID=A0A7K1L173_9ACTN|nr:hypothetical protein [Actinomadura litoris]MUN38141.1 hypothetical protein [Actinomadura litoris]
MPKGTVRGWLTQRRALPDAVQFATMLRYFESTPHALQDDDLELLPRLYQDALEHKNGAFYSPRPPAEDPPTDDPPPVTGVPIVLRVEAHARAQADGGFRVARTAIWAGAAFGLGVVLSTATVVSGSSQARWVDQSAPAPPPSAPQVVAATPDAPDTTSPEPKPEPKRSTQRPEPAPLPARPVPRHVRPARPKARKPPVPPTSTPEKWQCTSVTAETAAVYEYSDTGSEVIQEKARGEVIEVVRWTDTPQGWVMVAIWKPHQSHYWMQRGTLGPFRPSPTHCKND